MEIFIINTSNIDNIKPELLKKFKQKSLFDSGKLKEHCFSYLMLDRILKEVYKIQNRELEFIKRKPYLKIKEKFFSISHCKEYLVIAFSDNECGIDIEKIKNRDYIAISKRMKFNCTTLEEFYKEWTQYEAKYKLGQDTKSIYQSRFEDYYITAVSNNIQESFDIYIQNGENFSNS